MLLSSFLLVIAVALETYDASSLMLSYAPVNLPASERRIVQLVAVFSRVVCDFLAFRDELLCGDADHHLELLAAQV